MPDEKFENGETFSRAFVNMLLDTLQYQEGEEEQRIYGMLSDFIGQNLNLEMDELFRFLSRMCRECKRPIVLIIDEVDSAGNNQVFVQFLALLRGAYLKRDRTPMFHSVILAGVYSIKNLKLKLRPEAEHQYNSPWNIAADYDIDMSFSAKQIAGMLEEYEAEHQTGMALRTVAEEIYAYTSGYPMLVSLICKRIDEKIMGSVGFEEAKRAWSKEGIENAVGMILKESNLLFESMVKQLDTYEELYRIVEDILYCGKRIPYSLEEKSINLGVMFGFLKEENGHVTVANRLFEMCLLNMFMAREAIRSEVYTQGGRNTGGNFSCCI